MSSKPNSSSRSNPDSSSSHNSDSSSDSSDDEGLDKVINGQNLREVMADVLATVSSSDESSDDDDTFSECSLIPFDSSLPPNYCGLNTSIEEMVRVENLEQDVNGSLHGDNLWSINSTDYGNGHQTFKHQFLRLHSEMGGLLDTFISENIRDNEKLRDENATLNVKAKTSEEQIHKLEHQVKYYLDKELTSQEEQKRLKSELKKCQRDKSVCLQELHKSQKLNDIQEVQMKDLDSTIEKQQEEILGIEKEKEKMILDIKKIEFFNAETQVENQELKNTLDELKEQMETVSKENQNFEVTCEELKNELEQEQQQNHDMIQKLQIELNNKGLENSQLIVQIEELQKQQESSANDLEEMQKEIQEAEERFKIDYNELEQKNNQMNLNYKRIIDEREKHIRELSSINEELNEQIDKLGEEVDIVNQKEKVLTSMIENKDTEINDLSNKMEHLRNCCKESEQRLQLQIQTLMATQETNKEANRQLTGNYQTLCAKYEKCRSNLEEVRMENYAFKKKLRAVEYELQQHNEDTSEEFHRIQKAFDTGDELKKAEERMKTEMEILRKELEEGVNLAEREKIQLEVDKIQRNITIVNIQQDIFIGDFLPDSSDPQDLENKLKQLQDIVKTITEKNVFLEKVILRNNEQFNLKIMTLEDDKKMFRELQELLKKDLDEQREEFNRAQSKHHGVLGRLQDLQEENGILTVKCHSYQNPSENLAEESIEGQQEKLSKLEKKRKELEEKMEEETNAEERDKYNISIDEKRKEIEDILRQREEANISLENEVQKVYQQREQLREELKELKEELIRRETVVLERNERIGQLEINLNLLNEEKNRLTEELEKEQEQVYKFLQNDNANDREEKDESSKDQEEVVALKKRHELIESKLRDAIKHLKEKFTDRERKLKASIEECKELNTSLNEMKDKYCDGQEQYGVIKIMAEGYANDFEEEKKQKEILEKEMRRMESITRRLEIQLRQNDIEVPEDLTKDIVTVEEEIGGIKFVKHKHKHDEE